MPGNDDEAKLEDIRVQVHKRIKEEKKLYPDQAPAQPKKTSHNNIILEIGQFCSLDMKVRDEYLSPWIKEGTIGLISGWRGIGKTFFLMGILDAVSNGTSFGPWQCQTSVPCLLLDGEMPTEDVIDRSRTMGLTSARKNPFYIYSDAYSNSKGKTLRRIIMTVGQIMSYAIRHRYINYNPVKDAERPKDQGGVKEHKIRILTPDEIKALLEAEKDLKYKTLFMLAIMSGARQGELLGLKWSDVDWKNNQIHIQRTYNNKAWYDTKTATSNRRIDLGPVMMTALKKWKLPCPITELNLVFPNKAGNPINHDNMCRRYFWPVLKKAGLGKVRFHDLRHTYASLLIEQGENLKYIQTQLGHSNPTVTLNVYAHLMRPYNPESARRLENSVFTPTGHNLVTNAKNG